MSIESQVMKNKYYTTKPVDTSKLGLALERAKKELDIIQRAFNGESYASIGKAYGVSRQRIEQIIKRHYASEERVIAQNNQSMVSLI